MVFVQLAGPVTAAPAAETAGRASHDELTKRRSDSGRYLGEGREVTRKDLLGDGKKEGKDGEGKGFRPSTESLIGRSAIVSSARSWTIVPKEAVLHVPGHLSNRVNGTRNGELITWADFIKVNRGWIRLHEVTMEQATGDAEIDEETRKSFAKTGQLVVAAYHSGPISVKPLKKKPAEAGKPNGTVANGTAAAPGVFRR